jgi:hypothetical protein
VWVVWAWRRSWKRMHGQRLMPREQQMSWMGDGSRLQGPGVGLRHDKGVIRRRKAGHLKLLGLLCSVAAPVWGSALPRRSGRRRRVIGAFDAGPANAGLSRPALLIAGVIAGD